MLKKRSVITCSKKTGLYLEPKSKKMEDGKNLHLSVEKTIKLKPLLSTIYSQFSLPNAKERRRLLNEEMESLNSAGKNCFNCNGMCCTYEFNSMQVDPLQALEIVDWLETNDLLNAQVMDQIEQVIEQYRLDKDFFIGPGREFRRNYTCPFFFPGNRGCSLSRHIKPYGCLGFNPLKKGVKSAGHCSSNIELLSERDDGFESAERAANVFIKDFLELYWDKKSLPFALRDIFRQLSKKRTKIKE